jgi:hypothetical protein
MTDPRKHWVIIPTGEKPTIVYGTSAEVTNYADALLGDVFDCEVVPLGPQDNVNLDALIENAVKMFGLMQKQSALLTDVLRVVASRLPKNR